MAYVSRSYTDEYGEPVAVVVTTGTHDIGRLLALFSGSPILVEQLMAGERLRRQLRRHDGGRAALALLREHGGPDFTSETEQDALDGQALAALMVAAEQLLLDCASSGGAPLPQRKRAVCAAIDGVERRFFDVLVAAVDDMSQQSEAVAV